MAAPRVSFLPAFFTVLTVVFVIAVAFRITSYTHRDSAVSLNREMPAPERAAPRVPPEAAPESAPVADTSGTIVEANGKSAPAGRRLRDERYRELLSTPVPVPPKSAADPGGAAASAAARTATAPPPAPKPSILSRIVDAIKSSPTAPSPPPRQQATASRPAEPSKTSGDKSGDKPREKDPSSDTTPPQLVGIEFAPPSVHDGEATQLTINATDDMSGIRTVVGNVVGPSGAFLGFALTRNSQSDLYTGRVTVPKDAADGIWHINYLNLSDNAGNARTFSWAQGLLPQTAAFRVTSARSDSAPPTLKAVWLDRPSMKVGERNTMFVQAEDDKSGVTMVTAVFTSPQKFARFGVGCKVSGNMWNCELQPPPAAECGDWQLEQIQLQDAASNSAAVRTDNPLVARTRLNILTDQCDSHPPQLRSITVEPLQVGRPGAVALTISATDDVSGVGSVSGYFVYTGPIDPGSRPPMLPFYCRVTSDPQTWVATVPIEATRPRGGWVLTSVQLVDKANNIKVFTQGEPMVGSVGFKVE